MLHCADESRFDESAIAESDSCRWLDAKRGMTAVGSEI